MNNSFALTMDNFTNVFQVVPSNGSGSVTAVLVVLDPTQLNYDDWGKAIQFPTYVCFTVISSMIALVSTLVFILHWFYCH